MEVRKKSTRDERHLRAVHLAPTRTRLHTHVMHFCTSQLLRDTRASMHPMHFRALQFRTRSRRDPPDLSRQPVTPTDLGTAAPQAETVALQRGKAAARQPGTAAAAQPKTSSTPSAFPCKCISMRSEWCRCSVTVSRDGCKGQIKVASGCTNLSKPGHQASEGPSGEALRSSPQTAKNNGALQSNQSNPIQSNPIQRRDDAK